MQSICKTPGAQTHQSQAKLNEWIPRSCPGPGTEIATGKCPNWTSSKYWWYNLQQILESDVQKPQNGTFTKPLSSKESITGWWVLSHSQWKMGKSLRIIMEFVWTHGWWLSHPRKKYEFPILFFMVEHEELAEIAESVPLDLVMAVLLLVHPQFWVKVFSFGHVAFDE